ncbi:MAG: M48 family metalloprotease, partial [Sphingomonadales bacterium]
SYRVLKNGLSLCGDKTTKHVGVQFTNISAYSREWRETAASLLSLDRADRLTIRRVPDGSPADMAGIRVGDVLVSVAGKPTGRGKNAAAKAMRSVARALKQNPDHISLQLERNGTTLNLTVQAEEICDSFAILDDSDIVNAFADGKYIHVTRGMMRFARTDEELALIVGHEVGHNVMLHIEKKKKNAMGGALLGALLDGVASAYGVRTDGKFTKTGMQAGANAYSPKFEQEADYVGIYLMEHAGYDISKGPNFWRRMATVNPGSILYAGTHPTTVNRFLALDQTVAEINSKKLRNVALRPDMKDQTPEQQTMLASAPPPAGTGTDQGGTASAFVPTGTPEASSAIMADESDSSASDGTPPYAVHLATYRKLDSARNGWTVILTEHADLLQGLNPRVADPEGDTGLQLRAGPVANENEALELCEKLKARALYCTVTRFTGGSLN